MRSRPYPADFTVQEMERIPGFQSASFYRNRNETKLIRKSRYFSPFWKPNISFIIFHIGRFVWNHKMWCLIGPPDKIHQELWSFSFLGLLSLLLFQPPPSLSSKGRRGQARPVTVLLLHLNYFLTLDFGLLSQRLPGQRRSDVCSSAEMQIAWKSLLQPGKERCMRDTVSPLMRYSFQSNITVITLNCVSGVQFMHSFFKT